MINAVIIDDEKDARYLLRNLLTKNFQDKISIVAEADDIESGKTIIEQYKPQVVFLDIQMPGGTGFDLLEKFEAPEFEVIFITAHNNYAVKAFQFSAFGYLLKPIKVSELQSVLEKLNAQLEKSNKNEDPRMKVLIENYGDETKIKKLVVTNIEGFQVLNLEEVIRLEGDRNYTHFIVKGNKKITTSKTIGEYEELLHDFGFFRAHQSTIINLRHVTGYHKSDEEIEMVDNKKIKLSRYRKSEFIKRFI